MSIAGLALAMALVAQTTPLQVYYQPRVTFRTDYGSITISLDATHAPVTTCNFLRYVQHGRFSRGSFFRTVVRESNDDPNAINVIQAATRHGSNDPGLGPIPLERTRDTGLSHLAGTISMARDGPDTATSSFFIVVEDSPSLDFGGTRNPDGQGFAAFGKVVAGMEAVHGIHRAAATAEALDDTVLFSQVYATGDYRPWCEADATGFISGPSRPALK